VSDANIGFEGLLNCGHARKHRVDFSVDGLHVISLSTHDFDQCGINQPLAVFKVVVEHTDDTSRFFSYSGNAKASFGKILQFLDSGIENRLTKWHVITLAKKCVVSH